MDNQVIYTCLITLSPSRENFLTVTESSVQIWLVFYHIDGYLVIMLFSPMHAMGVTYNEIWRERLISAKTCPFDFTTDYENQRCVTKICPFDFFGAKLISNLPVMRMRFYLQYSHWHYVFTNYILLWLLNAIIIRYSHLM